MWNYRLVRRTHRDGTRTYAIHEAFYDDSGRVWGITAEPVEVLGESWQEARRDYRAMEHAFRGPVLPWESVPEEGAKAPTREGQQCCQRRGCRSVLDGLSRVGSGKSYRA